MSVKAVAIVGVPERIGNGVVIADPKGLKYTLHRDGGDRLNDAATLALVGKLVQVSGTVTVGSVVLRYVHAKEVKNV